ncbi:uncharacterized protein DUF4163 [Sediminitomix flava]|uniref:Uncharacterized protein DUF4163 n=2 Tax=Sediminitomix flava TaxID=379075 RepID=A0A315Z548_SEDFL|nr:uncharacterized protein DUF4163 [Sediminitomix flava]
MFVACESNQTPEEKLAEARIDAKIIDRYVHLNESFKRNKEDIDSTYFDVKYPILKLENYNSDSVINAQVFHDLKESIAGKGQSTIQKQMKDFVSDYKRFIKRHEDYKHNWTSQFRVDVSTYIPPLVVFKREMIMYTGGAHPNYGYAYQNFDADTGKEIKLEDIFVENYEHILEKIGETAFKQEHKIVGSLLDANFTFPRNKFYVPEEFTLLHKSIMFMYPLYAVAPYSKGSIHFEIPYTELKSIIKPNSIIQKITRK